MDSSLKTIRSIPVALNRAFISFLCGVLVLLISSAVLLGWFFDLPTLVRIQPYWVPMVVNTAICCFLSGIALVLSFLFKHDIALEAQKIIGGIVLVIASLVMLEILFGINLNIDNADLHRPLQPEYAHPGRMAPNSALALILFSIGLLMNSLARINNTKRTQRVQMLAIGVFILGWLGFLGYWLNLEYLYNWTGVVRMSIPTAICLILMGAALFNLHNQNAQENDQDLTTSVKKIYYISAFVITLVCLAAGVSGFATLAQRTDDMIAHNLLQVAKDRMFFFDVAIRARSERAILVSKELHFAELVSRLNQHPKDTLLQKKLAQLSQPLVKSGFTSVAFEGLNGKVWRGVGELSQHNQFIVKFHGTYSGLLLWEAGYLLHSKNPLYDNKGNLTGFMITEQKLEALNQLREQAIQVGSSRDMIICSAAGNYLDCFPSSTENQPFRVEKFYQKQRLPMSYAVDLNETGIKTTLDYRGVRVIAAHGPIADTGLGLVVKIDVAEIYAPIKEQLQKAALFITSLLALGLWLIRKHLIPLVKSIDAARAQAEQERAKFIVAAEGGFDSFYIFDAVRDAAHEITDFRCTFVNQRGNEFISMKPGEFVGKLLCEELPYTRSPMHFDRIKQVIETGEPAYDELHMDELHVKKSWIARQIVKLGDGVAITVSDITKQKDIESRMRYIAMHDVLTELPNRALYEDRAKVALEHAKRDKQQVAIALIDIDYFKRVNDTLGHHVGDALLQQIAIRLSQNIRPSDTLARLGGDEFALVLPNISHPEGSTVVLEKIFAALQQPVIAAGHELRTSLSIGVCVYPDDGTELSTLLRHADEAMYNAKAAGRNNFQIYQESKTGASKIRASKVTKPEIT